MEIGDIISERYRLDTSLGEGGYGVVFRATDVLTHRRVAIKTIRADAGRDAAVALRRFEREAKVLGSLVDPHTLRLFDFGATAAGELYVVTELVDGLPLGDRLTAGRGFEPEVVVRVIEQVASSLREAHARGIVPRDVKPDNILVYEYGGDPWCAKLIDFGLVALLETGDGRPGTALTAEGTTVGTVRYMAPEQLRGAGFGPWSDVYSLGMVALHMLTGEKPFPREDQRLQIEGVLSTRCSVPPDPGIPPELRALIDRMVSPDPAERPMNGEEVLAALDAMQSPARTPRPADTNRPASRNLIVVGLAAVAALVALGGGVLILASPPAHRSQVPVSDVPPAQERPTTATQAAAGPSAPKEPNVVVVERGTDARAEKSSTQTTATRSSGCGIAHEPKENGRVALVASIRGRQVDWFNFTHVAYDPEYAHPLLLVLPDQYRSHSSAMDRTGITEWAQEHRVVVAAIRYVDASGVVLRDIEDLGLLIDQILEEFCIDPTRIYALGNGESGRVVENLGCVRKLAAVASVSYRGSGTRSLCGHPSPVPLITVSGTDDPHAPLDGGVNCLGRPVLTLDSKEEYWRDLHHCAEDRTTFFSDDHGECTLWRCKDASFASCRVEGGLGWNHPKLRGETVGSVLAGTRCAETPTEFGTLDALLAFFDLHGLNAERRE